MNCAAGTRNIVKLVCSLVCVYICCFLGWPEGIETQECLAQQTDMHVCSFLY